MKRADFLPLLLASLALTALPACGDGTDDGTGGGTSGGSDSGGTGGGSGGTGASTGGGGTGGSGGTGASTSGGGSGGEYLPGGGDAVVDFNGTTVNFDVYTAAVTGDLGFITASDSIDSETVDSWSIQVREPAVGTFDCANGTHVISMQADDGDGETTNFDSVGGSSCTITITEWGAVGGAVRGTFSGELVAAGSMTATLTNGSFDLIRGTD